MEDSPLNPYIPQESTDIRQRVTQAQSPLRRIMRTALIVTGALSLIVGAALFFIVPRTSVVDTKARQEMAAVLQPPSQVSKLLPVSSTRGFSLAYETQLYTSYAETAVINTKEDIANNAKVLGVYFENNDLRTPREYSLVRIRPVESADASRSMVTQPPELEVRAYSPKLLDDNATRPEYKGLSRQALFMKISSEQRLAARDAGDGTTLTVEESKPSSRTINDVQYQKIRYTTTNDNYRVTNTRYDDCYYTLQNELPYSACIVNVRPHNTEMASLVEQVLESLTFKAPSEGVKAEDASEKKAAMTTTVKLAQATKDDESEPATSVDEEETQEPEEAALVTKKQEYNENPLSLRALAVNQPSVVRIASLYCADLALKMENGDTGVTLTDACVGKLSSGAIVSRDGHIATTASAVQYDPEAAINGYINFAESTTEMENRLNRVLDYLLKARIILQTDADYLKRGARSGDQEALAKIENIGSIIPNNYVTPTNEKSTYAIQPTDRPIVINRTAASKPEFAYSDSVREAKFVASNFDTKKTKQETFDAELPEVDTALLKMEGSFQSATIASGDSVKANDKLNVLGFPAFSDAGLTVERVRNMPFATVATVDQTFKSDNHRAIQINSAIVPGNNGAPVFDQAANLIGFGVYGLSYCPNQQCFATGTVRSSNELLAMLEKENIKLGEPNDATIIWTQAVDSYIKGNYAAAANQFSKAADAYSFNMWAKKMAELAAKKQGSASDTSLMNQLQTILIAILAISGVVTMLLVAAYFIHKRRIDSLQVGHYGATMPSPMSTPAVTPQPIMSQPVAQSWQQTPQVGQVTPPASDAWPQQAAAPVSPPQPQTTTVDAFYQSAPVNPPTPPTPTVQPPAVPQPQSPQGAGSLDDDSNGPFYVR